uniref:Uncharacterized protein n=1 Tax=Tetranychus urticae TaxID=32264 RepID=T1JXS9_TETUR
MATSSCAIKYLDRETISELIENYLDAHTTLKA